MFPNTRNLDMSAPEALGAIEAATIALGFGISSEAATGALLRKLASLTPGGKILELGTGTGLATCWLLDGMDDSAELVSVDNDATVQAVASTCLGEDPRLTLVCEDGEIFLSKWTKKFDLVFADAWPGKFSHLEEALALLSYGAIYVVDDLLPQANWPEGHAPKVPAFIAEVSSKQDLDVEYREWSSGILVAQKHSR